MSKITKENCEEWFQNPLKNPLTKRSIQEGKGVYKQLEKDCQSFKEKKIVKSPKAIQKSKSDKSPSLGVKKSKIRKPDCKSPKYKWVVGKGCFETKEEIGKEFEKEFEKEKFTESKNYGLQIGSYIFSQLSGPEYCSILVPNRIFANQMKKEGFQFPIFLLFGDLHTPVKGKLCRNRTASLINSGSFLKSLNEIATKECKVEFAVESFIPKGKLEKVYKLKPKEQESYFKGIEKEFEKDKKFTDQLITSTVKLNLSCFYHKSPVKKQVCKTNENIKWQFSDIRNLRYPYREQTEHVTYWIESYLFNLIHLIQPKDTLKESFFIQQANMIKKYCEHYKLDLEEILNKTKLCLYSFFLNFKDFITYIYKDEIFKHYSVIVKQITKKGVNKQHKSILPLIYNWIDEYAKYIELIFPFQLHDKQSIINQLDLFFDIFVNYVYNKGDKSQIELLDFPSIETYLIARLSFLLDIYYFCRTLKTENSDVPILAISLFGAAHSENIKYFFEYIVRSHSTIFKYQSKRDNKCIDFSNVQINLNQEIEKYC